MDFNYVFIVALLILLASIIRGSIRGFLKSCLSLAALLLAGVLVMAINPFVTGFLRNSTGLDEWIQERAEALIFDGMGAGAETEEDTIILSQDVTVPADIRLPDGTFIPAGTVIPAGTELPAGIGFDEFKEQLDTGLSAAQESQVIESLPLPDSLKNALEENNNSAVYGQMGAEGFTDYIGGFISNICLNIIGYLLTFLLVFFALHILLVVFNVVDRIPVIHGINHMAGALLGIVKGLLILEILLLLLVPFTGTGWGSSILNQVESSRILSFLYHKNILVSFLMKIAGM